MLTPALRRRVLTLIFSVLAPVMALAGTYSVGEVPNVHLADSTRFVSNPDGILSASAQNAIDAHLRSLMAGTTAEVAVVAVDDIDADVEPDDFATELFRKWGLGKRDNENGLLMLVVKDRRKVVIRTGYGLEGLLPDGLCGSIIRREILPRFREGDFDGGTAAGVEALTAVIADPAAADEVRSRYANNARADRDGDELFGVYLGFCAVATVVLMLLFVSALAGGRGKPDYDRYRKLDRLWVPVLFCSFLCLGMPLVVLLPLWVARKRARRGRHVCPNCGTSMNLVDEEHDNDYLTPVQDTEERINSIDYDVWLCPNCGTTEILPYVQRGSAFEECPHCGARALELVSNRVLRQPSVGVEGIGVRVYRCRHCKREVARNYSIPALPPVVVIPGGGRGGGFGGGFGGGSFGGGSTGGGGASGGW